MSDAKQRTAKPGGLLDQWNLLAEIIADGRTRKPHIQIAQTAIDRYRANAGNSRASVRYLAKATGLSKWRLSKATAELAEWGYFARRPGIGTRPSEFTPSWPSVRVQGDTIQPMLVSESGGTGCPSLEGHYGPLVSESGGTNPAYVDGLQAGLREAESSVGAATPPASAGPAGAVPPGTPPGSASATVPDAPANGFAEIWDAFNLKLTNTKTRARAAYDKLSPDAGLHATMVEAAARLHAHYEEHSTERRYRIQCHNWINARGWEDDLPIVYADAKSAAISKVRGSAKAKSVSQKCDERVVPCVVTGYAEEGSPFADWHVTLDFQPEEGGPFSRKFHVLTTGGDGPDLDAYNDAARAVFGKGKPLGEWVGRYVGIDKSGYWHLPDYQPESPMQSMSELVPASSITEEAPKRRLTIDEAEREAYEAFLAENDI
jgi:hypothetical protein